jgi:hypothetical protein
MPPIKLTDEAPHLRPGFKWSAEQEQWAAACAEAKEKGGLAAQFVLIVTQFGLEGVGGFLGAARYHREELNKAAADLERVGTHPDLAQLVRYAATKKPKAPQGWRARLNARHRKRTKELRKKTALNHR